MGVVEEQTSPIVDWPKVGSHLKEVLIRLEDAKGDGKGLRARDASGEGIVIADVGKAGFDVSAKSYEWRTGYFETLLLSATAAEHLDNMVLDTRRKKVFPREVMLGPSNPDPRPTPVYMDSAPREEDCVKFYSPPETFYMKILTTEGFNTRQKLEAVEGYANWLEFKGLNGAAEEMYKWGVDIAKSALPDPGDADTVFEPRTNVVRADSIHKATSNLLRATTSLATHHARTGDTAAALPILLSVLRARRSAPLSPNPLTTSSAPPEPKTDIGAAYAMVKRWISPATFPPEPPSDDTPLMRSSEKPTCEEGELMVYIGEILFASSHGSEGVGWTRQGVLVAEANLQRRSAPATSGAEAERREVEGRKCKQCLLTGVKNWEQMLRQLTESRISTSTREGGRDAGWLEWKGWFGGQGDKGRTLDEVGAGVLEEELTQVEKLKERIVRENIEVELSKGKVQGAPWFG